jgi:hypothetical protein
MAINRNQLNGEIVDNIVYKDVRVLFVEGKDDFKEMPGKHGSITNRCSGFKQFEGFTGMCITGWAHEKIWYNRL